MASAYRGNAPWHPPPDSLTTCARHFRTRATVSTAAGAMTVRNFPALLVHMVRRRHGRPRSGAELRGLRGGLGQRIGPPARELPGSHDGARLARTAAEQAHDRWRRARRLRGLARGVAAGGHGQPVPPLGVRGPCRAPAAQPPPATAWPVAPAPAGAPATARALPPTTGRVLRSNRAPAPGRLTIDGITHAAHRAQITLAELAAQVRDMHDGNSASAKGLTR